MSRISLWRIVGKPPMWQIIAWSTEKFAPQLHLLGILLSCQLCLWNLLCVAGSHVCLWVELIAMTRLLFHLPNLRDVFGCYHSTLDWTLTPKECVCKTFPLTRGCRTSSGLRQQKRGAGLRLSYTSIRTVWLLLACVVKILHNYCDVHGAGDWSKRRQSLYQ